MFDRIKAMRDLDAGLERLNKVSPNIAMHLSNGHIHSDAILAVSQATGCRLEAMAQAMVFMGLSLAENDRIAYRNLESPEVRQEHSKLRLELLELTEQLMAQALEAECQCHKKEEPAPFLGERG